MPRKIPDLTKMVAVAQIEFLGKRPVDVARELGVSISAVHQWRRDDYPFPKKEWADPFAALPLEKKVILYRQLQERLKNDK